MTQLAGIYGYPLAHSISPAFQQAAFDHYELPVRYEAWPTPPERLADEVRKLREERYLGANVTVPHKEQVMAHLDHIDLQAEAIGAVNTVAKENGRLVGYNTDAYGFIRSLRERGGQDPRGLSVLLLGAGGAARAAAFALVSEGAAALVIANRTADRAKSLASEVTGKGATVSAIPWTPADLKQAAAKADLIVNSTSLGMLHGDGEDVSPLTSEEIAPDALVVDMVYNPTETPLLRQAGQAGARTLGGLAMLIYQGAAAFERWTGREAPVDVMFRAGEQALAAQPPQG